MLMSWIWDSWFLLGPNVCRTSSIGSATPWRVPLMRKSYVSRGKMTEVPVLEPGKLSASTTHGPYCPVFWSITRRCSTEKLSIGNGAVHAMSYLVSSVGLNKSERRKLEVLFLSHDIAFKFSSVWNGDNSQRYVLLISIIFNYLNQCFTCEGFLWACLQVSGIAHIKIVLLDPGLIHRTPRTVLTLSTVVAQYADSV